METQDIVRYLSDGALVEILSRGSGGDDSRHVWLRQDERGAITHTFDAREGEVGGAPVPLHTLNEDHIFEPNVTAVLGYLQTFGLSRAQAQQVVAAVGTR